MYLIQITEHSQDFIARYFNEGVVPQIEESPTWYQINDGDVPNEIIASYEYLDYTRGTGYNGPDRKSILLEHV